MKLKTVCFHNYCIVLLINIRPDVVPPPAPANCGCTGRGARDGRLRGTEGMEALSRKLEVVLALSRGYGIGYLDSDYWYWYFEEDEHIREVTLRGFCILCSVSSTRWQLSESNGKLFVISLLKKLTPIFIHSYKMKKIAITVFRCVNYTACTASPN